MLSQAISAINGKGGTFKTSIVANLAGLMALADYRVLAVDLDPQGNLGRDLGYLTRGESDDGKGMFQAVATGSPLEPLRDVRPKLDVICGGHWLEDMTAMLTARASRGQSVNRVVLDHLRPLVDRERYDLVLFDCPPGIRQLQMMALTATHYVVIPIKSDEASLDGLQRVADLFGQLHANDNPGLEMLGVVLVGMGRGSTRIADRVRQTVAAELGDAGLVFDTRIRHVEGPAQDCRRRGQLAHEIESDFLELRKARIRSLAAGERPASTEDALAASTPGLAQDYQEFAGELTSRISRLATVSAS